jgi:hypothetical protein
MERKQRSVPGFVASWQHSIQRKLSAAVILLANSKTNAISI